jgi:uncharacterized protein (TIGR02145 family)
MPLIILVDYEFVINRINQGIYLMSKELQQGGPSGYSPHQEVPQKKDEGSNGIVFSASNIGAKGEKDKKKSTSPKSAKRVIIIVAAVIAVACATTVIVYFTVRAARMSPDILWYTANPKATNFTISTAEELASLAQIVNGTWGRKPARDNFVGKTITLAENIDLSQYENWMPIGNQHADSGSVFSGTFDGGSHVVSNLKINRSDADRQGLFGRIEGGMVKNIGLDGVNIKGRGRIGAVAGTVGGGGGISNSYSTGSVIGTFMVGGIAGAIADSSVVTGSHSASSVSGDTATGGVAGGINGNSRVVSCYSTGVVSGRYGVGGVAGQVLSTSRVIGSYSTGAVSGENGVGGVAGLVLSNSGVASSYSIGAVSGGTAVGGVAGSVGHNGSVAGSYSSGTVSGIGDFVGGVAGNVFNNSRVAGSYSAGAVSSTGNSVGGVVGRVHSGSRIINCAALNPEVKGTGTNVGRVAGFAEGTLANNAAYAGMRNSAGNARWTNEGAATANGAGITVAAIRSDSALGGRFTAVNRWVLQSGSLPGIGTPAAMPLHLRALRIGNLQWMPENFNCANHTNGTSWCYDDTDSNCVAFGRLYTWEAAMSVCPTGWRLPTRADWNDLVQAAGGAVAGRRLKSKTGWESNGNGVDDFGFSAMPGGYNVNGAFHSAGVYGGWWSATESEGGNVFYRFMSYNNNQVQESNNADKNFGMAVRCVR